MVDVVLSVQGKKKLEINQFDFQRLQKKLEGN